MNDLFVENNEPEIDQNKNYLDELVGPGKKFATVEDMAKGKYQSDMYIKTLERRHDESREDMKRLREESMAQASLRELIDQINKNQQLASSEPPRANEELKPAIDPDHIKSLVSNTVQEIEMNKRQQENYNLVVSKLRENFGENYPQVLRKYIEDLDLTEDDVNRLARTNPKVLFRALGLGQQTKQQTFESPVRSSQRSDSFSPTVQKRTWSYYQKLKRENPILYNDPKTTVQMHKDYIELGKEFEDGDFNN